VQGLQNPNIWKIWLHNFIVKVKLLSHLIQIFKLLSRMWPEIVLFIWHRTSLSRHIILTQTSYGINIKDRGSCWFSLFHNA
jgi:hypothetical protein